MDDMDKSMLSFVNVLLVMAATISMALALWSMSFAGILASSFMFGVAFVLYRYVLGARFHKNDV